MNFNSLFHNIKNIFRQPNALSEAIYDEDAGYRNISSSVNIKELNQLNRDQQLKLVFNLWLKNGFAKRLIQIVIDFVVGSEMYTPDFKSKDDSLSDEQIKACQDLIADFNEKNKFCNKFEKFATDLGLNGMLLLPCVNSGNGDVTIGFIDPAKIDKVITNPFDVTDVTSVRMKSDFMANAKVFQIVRKISAFDQPVEGGDEKDYDLLYGDAFYHAVNNVSNQPEGISDLLADIDMIQKLYELLTSVVDSVKLANLFVLDVTIEGADANKIKEWKKNNPIPSRATRTIHNDKVKQELMGTNIRAFNGHEVIRTMKNFILGNSSFPTMWFADGEDANRAIAIEQGTPIYKKLSKRQEILIDIIKNIYMYVIHSAVRDKEGFELKKEDLENLIMEIKAPEIEIKNLDRITLALEKLTGSLEKAQSNKWLTGKTIRKAFINFINMLGFDINVEAEESALETEAIENPEPDPNNPIDPENPEDPNNPIDPKMKLVDKKKIEDKSKAA